MRVLQLPQGYYRDLTGTPLVKALVMFDKDDTEFLQHNPQCLPYHRACWQVRQVRESEHGAVGPRMVFGRRCGHIAVAQCAL